MKPILISLLAALLCTLISNPVVSQEYKIRQSSAVMGMKIETTVYVKGMRKRTESAAVMGMTQPVTIEQCDLQRTIKINDKKKLYYIDSFYKTQQEVIDEDEPMAKKPTPVVKEKNTKTPEKGGVITIYYSIRDTGERKKMYGLTARHVWTTQKMKPSPDACMMKDSILVKTDGWYIDLPKFNCPVRYTPPQVQKPTEKKPTGMQGPVCNPEKRKRKAGLPVSGNHHHYHGRRTS